MLFMAGKSFCFIPWSVTKDRLSVRIYLVSLCVACDSSAALLILRRLPVMKSSFFNCKNCASALWIVAESQVSIDMYNLVRLAIVSI